MAKRYKVLQLFEKLEFIPEFFETLYISILSEVILSDSIP